MKLKLSEAPGKQTFMHFNGDEKTVVTEQTVDPIIAANKRLANDWRYGNLIGNTQRHQQKSYSGFGSDFFCSLGASAAPAQQSSSLKQLQI